MLFCSVVVVEGLDLIVLDYSLLLHVCGDCGW